MRLCSAEIISMKGDLKRLINNPINLNINKSLQERLKSANQTLEWLCRKEVKPSHLIIFKKLRLSLNKSRYSEALINLDILSNEFPFIFNDKYDDSDQDIEEAGKIYKSYCASCHDRENTSISFPIYSLTDMAKKQSKSEFLARMLIGVRGSEVIVFRNPLTDKDIVNIRKYLISK